MIRAAAARSDAGAAEEIGAHADAAMRAVRVLVAVLACVLLGAYRPLVERPSWWSIGWLLGLIVAGTALMNILSQRARRTGLTTWLMQAIDVAATVGLAIALEGPLGQQSWMLLVIPIVFAAVRFGAFAVALSWLGGCIGYFAAVSFGLASSPDATTEIARTPGTLLALALTVGLLARWMREGWELQNELTTTIVGREQRLAVIESTIPALNGLEPAEALHLCVSRALDLGFAAANVHGGDGSVQHLVGDQQLVADPTGAPCPTLAEPTVTVWTDGDHVRAHSVSALEPETKTIVTAWSRTPIDPDRAVALATLVRHTSAAIETTQLLHRLRQSADQDALTGLANRRSLDRELATRTLQRGRISVAFIDLDDFKAVNDRYGHDIGDKVLVALSERLRSVTGPFGTVTRYGGDEFVVVLPDVGPDDAELFGRAVLDAVAEPIAFGPAVVQLGMSVGVASAMTPMSSAALVRAADEAAYRAKAAGKHAVVCVDLAEGSSPPASPAPAEPTPPVEIGSSGG